MQSQQSLDYSRYTADECAKGNVLVECKGFAASLLYDLNDSRPGTRTPADFSPDPVTTDDAQDTPSPNGSLDTHSHIVFPFSKPLRPLAGLLFGSDDSVDFRLPGRNESYPTMSRICFRLFINEIGAWMFLNLSRSECKVNEDIICSTRCRHNPGLTSIALHPEAASLIRILDIEITIRLPTASCDIARRTWALRERLRVYPDASSQSTHSSTTQTLMGHRSTIPSWTSSTPKLRCNYHELQVSAVQGRFYMIRTLVDKETGSRVLGKIDNSSCDNVVVREENLSKSFGSLLKLCKDREYFVRLLDLKNVPSGRAMITEYRNALLLEEMDSLDTSDLLLVFAQIGGQALQYLWREDVVHTDIRPGTILVEKSNQTVSARLTGFSNMQALRDTAEKDKFADVRAIASIVRHTQPAEQSNTATLRRILCAEEQAKNNDAKRKYASVEVESLDRERHRASNTALYSPSLERLISLALDPHEICPSPHDIDQAFQQAIGCDRVRWPPFDTIIFDRTYTFNCLKRNGENFVQLDQFLEVVYEQSQIMLLIPSLGRHCRRETTHGTSYLSFDTATKLLHANKLLVVFHALLEEATRRNGDDDATFVIEPVVPVHVTCHWPSSMINLTQLSRIAGFKAREALRNASEPEGLQEIHGHHDWKGLYSHTAFVKSVLQHSNKELYDQVRNLRFADVYPYFDRSFRNIRYAEYAVLAFPRLQPHLVLIRREDFQVNISTIRGEVHFYDTRNANFSQCDIAVQACQELDLNDLASCLPKMESTIGTVNWKDKIYLNCEATGTADSLSDKTSLMTWNSLVHAKELYVEDPDAFRFGKQYGKRARPREFKPNQASKSPKPNRPILEELEE
ncbi:MAG: hypothetical protein Q9210_006613, partial [Variospora velana]